VLPELGTILTGVLFALDTKLPNWSSTETTGWTANVAPIEPAEPVG
jgi:hypothetical protein